MAAAVAQPGPSPASAPLYTNPVLFADYSDPDVIREGRDFECFVRIDGRGLRVCLAGSRRDLQGWRS